MIESRVRANHQSSTRRDVLVSIGMPVFNCARTVEQTVHSILNQTLDGWELIIIDDGSTDGTLERISSFRDERILVMGGDRNKRLPTRLNECIAAARGKYFARMDGDDIAYPDRLQAQIGFLETHPEIDLVGGWMAVFRSNGILSGVRRFPLTHEEICRKPWRGIQIAHPTWVGRTDWFRRHMYVDVRAAEDNQLLLRALEESRFANLPKIVQGYREDHLKLRYIYRQRWHACKCILGHARQGRYLSRAPLSLIAESGKGLLDTIAILTTLDYKLLRHRVGKVLPGETEAWHSTWNSCATEKVIAGSAIGNSYLTC